MMPKSKKLSNSYSVTINERLRRAHPWFEQGLVNSKERAVSAKRKSLRTTGPELKPQRVIALADRLEQIQRAVNPLLEEREKISKQLLAHWAHTGLGEIEGALGKTLVYPSFTVKLTEADLIRQSIALFPAISEVRLVPEKIMQYGDKAAPMSFQMAFIEAAKVAAKINIVAPSSRRPRSGGTEAEE